MELKHPQRSWWESVLFLVVSLAMLAFIVNSYFLEQKVYKQRALYYQIAILRQGVNLFAIVEKRFPDSLVELGISSFKSPGNGMNHPYIERFPANPDGKVFDPFGSPYTYDKKMGWVASTTPGYSFW